MQLSLLALLPLVAAHALSPNPVFTNPESSSSFKIPTSRESAIQARRILHLTPLGTLATVFPSEKSHSQDDAETTEQRPQGLGGVPIGLMDYFADCESTGNPTILAINIATSFKNVAAGSNISMSLNWTPPSPPRHSYFNPLSYFSPNDPRPLPYSAASLPRFSLIGKLEPISPDLVQTLKLAKCYTDKHPDAKYWLPGNPVHTSTWVRLVVEEVYWIGGFGDRAYIGWIPIEEWKSVERSEWEGIRLPGEEKGGKGWMDWLRGEL
ncbi:hypothetical protein LZ554_001181 [Drepanopeziza brunnea f. sp. 'monogermtubi']|nr:hypothetical protein LZ554_001181 [Drepanopeziza brunnea f. sp. 'monogermtubi']